MVLDKPAIIKGCRKGLAAGLVLGSVRYALPKNSRVQVQDITDHLDATEPFSAPGALARYWKTTHGIIIPAADKLYVRVCMEGQTRSFTYPSSTLLLSPLIIQPISQGEAHQMHIEELERRMLQDIAAMPVLQSNKDAQEQ